MENGRRMLSCGGFSVRVIAVFLALFGPAALAGQSVSTDRLAVQPKGAFGELFIPAKSVSVSSLDAGTSTSVVRADGVVISNGNKLESERDFESFGEIPLSLTRTYNHYWQGVGLFGRYWTSSFDYKLTFGTTALNSCYPRPGGGACSIGANTIIYAWRPDGRTIKYTKATDGLFYEDKPEPISRIELQVDGRLFLFTENGGLEIYSSAGYVERVRTRTNVGWIFSYNNGTYPSRVTHTSGKYVEFTWAGTQLTAIRDPAGNYYGYAYSANLFGTGLNRLASTSRPGQPAGAISYHYESSDSTALTGKSVNGARYSKYVYDSNRRVVSVENNGLHKFTFVYTAGANGALTVLETNPLGKQVRYQFSAGKLQSATQLAAANSPLASVALIEYDANGYPAMISDFNGNKTAFFYNSKGQLTRKIEAYGTQIARTTLYEWWPMLRWNQIKSETLVGAYKREYDYNVVGRLESITTTNLSSVGVANQVRVTTFTYSDYGQNINGVIVPGMLRTVVVNGPIAGSGDTVATNYDSLGNLISVANGLGHTVLYGAHNGLGSPGVKTGINGDLTEYTYDARGRMTRERRYPNGTTAADTLYSYNPNGTLASLTTPDGVVTSYVYDMALRLMSSRANGTGSLLYGATGERQDIQYDLAGNERAVSNLVTGTRLEFVEVCVGPGGEILTTCHLEERSVEYADPYQSAYIDRDELGRPQAYKGNYGRNVRQTYDGNGNISTRRDSSGNLTSYFYDALNRLTSVVDPGNKSTHYEYDAASRVKKVVDPRGIATTYAIDGFGQIWAQTNPDSGTTTYTYDSQGLRTATTRNDGSTITYSYDAIGRTIQYGVVGYSRTYTYDNCTNGKGRLCNATATGSSTHVSYEKDGRIKSRREVTAAGGITSDSWTYYYYDAVGRLSAITYPSGVAVGYGYSSGKLMTMTANVGGVIHNVISDSKYYPYGPVGRYTFGNSLQSTDGYDLDGRLSSNSVRLNTTIVQSVSIGYSTRDEVASIVDSVNSSESKSFTYDPIGRLASFGSSTGVEQLTYDANGNRLSVTGVSRGAGTYSISPSSGRLSSVAATSPGRSVVYQYDPRGNLSSASDSVFYQASYTYDTFNRLTRVIQTQSGATKTADYGYNALNERVVKGVTGLGFSRYIYAEGSRLLSERNGAGLWTDYLWFGGRLVGLVRNGTLQFIHTDHLGRPERVSNQARATTWRASNGAHDRSVVVDSIGGLNIGFPGQYFDVETGLWYNVNRYYDGKIGRYTQPDPIGLEGGLNRYLYAEANPVNYVDMLGLQSAPDGTDHVWRPPTYNCSFMIDCMEVMQPGNSECKKAFFSRINWAGNLLCQSATEQVCTAKTWDYCNGTKIPPIDWRANLPGTPEPETTVTVGELEILDPEEIFAPVGGGSVVGGGWIGIGGYGGFGVYFGTVTVGRPEPEPEPEPKDPDKE